MKIDLFTGLVINGWKITRREFAVGKKAVYTARCIHCGRKKTFTLRQILGEKRSS